jgi:aminoglycoside 2'-N-acetyltransferase I
MSMEIDVLNGDASWPKAEPLLNAVWPRHVVERLPWGHIEWAHADLRVLIDAPDDSAEAGLACHVGIYFRDALWDGRYATLALNAAVRTLRDHEAVRFALLFCEPHNEAFYQARGWHAFKGEVYAEQPGGRIRFEAMAPYIFDFTRKPRDGIIDLCGLPW